MIKAWEKQQLSYPETAHIVQEGIHKLESYRERVQDVPAYILSMRKFDIFIIMSLLTACQVINPAVKLRWFEKHWPERVQTVKDLFLHEVCLSIL